MNVPLRSHLMRFTVTGVVAALGVLGAPSRADSEYSEKRWYADNGPASVVVPNSWEVDYVAKHGFHLIGPGGEEMFATRIYDLTTERAAASDDRAYAPYSSDPAKAWIAIQRAICGCPDATVTSVRQMPLPSRSAVDIPGAPINAWLSGTTGNGDHFEVYGSLSHLGRDRHWEFEMVESFFAPAQTWASSYAIMRAIADSACGTDYNVESTACVARYDAAHAIR